MYIKNRKTMLLYFDYKIRKRPDQGPNIRLASKTKASSVPSYVIRTPIVNQSEASGSFDADIEMYRTR